MGLEDERHQDGEYRYYNEAAGHSIQLASAVAQSSVAVVIIPRSIWPANGLLVRTLANVCRNRDLHTASGEPDGARTSADEAPGSRVIACAAPTVAQAVLVEACSRKEFFDELADNLEARSDRYTNQSGPGITALF